MPLPTQPADRVPIHALAARIEDLPYLPAALARAAINRPGCTADDLLTLAEHLDDAVRECRLRDHGGLLEAECATWIALAGILRDAAPHRPHPPRMPLSARDADASVRRHAAAAGIAMCGDAG